MKLVGLPRIFYLVEARFAHGIGGVLAPVSSGNKYFRDDDRIDSACF